MIDFKLLMANFEAFSTRDRINLFMSSLSEYVPKKLIQHLVDNKFFEQYASSRFHGNYPGGLFDHSYCVMLKLIELTDQLNLKWQDKRSPYIIGMLHDLCKMDEYEVVDGIPHKIKDTPIIGHGDKSCILLSNFITLTEEEDLCIRYHMGAFNTKDWNAYGAAIEKYDTVLWTHTADMYISRLIV